MEKLGKTDKLVLALHLNVSMSMAEIITRLYNERVLLVSELVEDGVCLAPRRMVSKLRGLLATTGIEIHTHRGTGYWMDDTGRALLKAMLDRFQAQGPSQEEAEAELAAATREGNFLPETEV